MEIIQLKSSEVPETRKRILEEQGGVCIICGKVPKTPCLDHEHTRKVKGSGQVRGVICLLCNVFLGKIENNCGRYGIELKDLSSILRSVADYVERPHLPLMHPSEAPKTPKLTKTSYNKLKKVYSGKAKFPPFPKSGKMTKNLESLFSKHGIEPEFYK